MTVSDRPPVCKRRAGRWMLRTRLGCTLGNGMVTCGSNTIEPKRNAWPIDDVFEAYSEYQPVLRRDLARNFCAVLCKLN
jgi:hypothetical protein